MKAYRGRRYLVPVILNLGTRWTILVKFTARTINQVMLISQPHICTCRLHPRPLSTSSAIHIGHVTCPHLLPYIQNRPMATGHFAAVWYLTLCLTDNVSQTAEWATERGNWNCYCALRRQKYHPVDVVVTTHIIFVGRIQGRSRGIIELVRTLVYGSFSYIFSYLRNLWKTT